MIPALLLVFSAVVYRVTTGLLIHSGVSWLSNFVPLAAIALCSAAYLPKKYKLSVPLVTLFISDSLCGGRTGWMRGNSPTKSGIAEDAFTSFYCWIDNFLRGHQRVFLVERPRLHEKFRRTRSVAHVGIASIQRDAKLDVFPQFTR